MRARRVAAATLLTGVLVAVGGCTEAPPPAAEPATTTTEPTTEPTTESTETTVAVTTAVIPTTEPPAPAALSWVMPDLVGGNLQQAQDAIQALTEFAIAITTSTDVSGDDRAQVLDANWQVCSQNVAPGTAITAATRIDFGVVKIGERCP